MTPEDLRERARLILDMRRMLREWSHGSVFLIALAHASAKLAFQFPDGGNWEHATFFDDDDKPSESIKQAVCFIYDSVRKMGPELVLCTIEAAKAEMGSHSEIELHFTPWRPA
jgi:hypothetical protein